MKLEDTHYDAFISYRHTEPDMFAAKTLHKELEAFRLPKNLMKKLGPEETKKTRIRRVFRDQEELPISSDLKEPILNALRNSDFLIVICTPRLKESLWCCTEIEQFIAMHGQERVLAVLAGGEPEESFPPQLRFIERDGVRKEVEPLAADIRGASEREMRKKIKAETLRLAAPMFGCGYDDLRQRHRERRLKRILSATAAAAAVCFTFGAVSAGMALQIHKQSLRIESQKEELEAQYTEALRVNARSQAEEALRILNTGDRLSAIQTALAVLPGTESSKQPYTPQAEYALAQSLSVYEDGTRILPKHALAHEAAVDFMKLSPDAGLLLTADSYGKLYVWDALSGKIVYENEALAKVNLSPDTAGFLDDGRIFFPGVYGFCVCAPSEGKMILQEEQPYYRAAVSGDRSRYALVDEESVTVFSSADYRPLLKLDLPEEAGWGFETHIALDETGERLAYTWKRTAADGQEERLLSCVQLNAPEEAAQYSLGAMYVEQLSFLHDALIAAGNITEGMRSFGEAFCYDAGTDGGLRWSYRGRVLDSFLPVETPEGSSILLNAYDTLVLLQEDTGSELGQITYGSEAVDVSPAGEGGYLGVRLRNGGYHYLSLEDMNDIDMTLSGAFEGVPDNLEAAVMGKKYMASYSYHSTNIIVHTLAEGSRMNVILEDTGYLSGVFAKKDESAAVAWASDGLTALSMDTGETLWRTRAEEPVVAVAYLGREQEEIAVALPHALVLLDASTGEERKRLALEKLDLTCLKFSEDARQFALVTPREIEIYDTGTGKLLRQDTRLEELHAGVYALAEDLELYAAACPEEKTLKLLRTGDARSETDIPLNAACVQNIALCASADRMYVTYVDGRVEAYSVSEGALLKSYGDLGFEVQSVRPAGKGRVLALGPDAACVMGEDAEPVALLPGISAVLPNRGLYLTAGGGALRTFPVYDAAMLCGEAREALTAGGTDVYLESKEGRSNAFSGEKASEAP